MRVTSLLRHNDHQQNRRSNIAKPYMRSRNLMKLSNLIFYFVHYLLVSSPLIRVIKYMNCTYELKFCVNNVLTTNVFKFQLKMKIFGIDDNSEAFSLFVTANIGVLLFIFTYALHQKVMGSKDRSDVSVTWLRNPRPRCIKIFSFFSCQRIR